MEEKPKEVETKEVDVSEPNHIYITEVKDASYGRVCEPGEEQLKTAHGRYAQRISEATENGESYVSTIRKSNLLFELSCFNSRSLTNKPPVQDHCSAMTVHERISPPDDLFLREFFPLNHSGRMIPQNALQNL
ncbi:hypothetical protein DdX_18899 [Ditylenchus destructor]|uniref:Uncharacterized protein n=1 Tax=Ditylenchus destructor TaxID=166010 RepID=A0AAD4MJE2_9BILA|nr:hypothetical protein DdX_18899 [Ditylenchus destructor]